MKYFLPFACVVWLLSGCGDSSPNPQIIVNEDVINRTEFEKELITKTVILSHNPELSTLQELDPDKMFDYLTGYRPFSYAMVGVMYDSAKKKCVLATFGYKHYFELKESKAMITALDSILRDRWLYTIQDSAAYAKEGYALREPEEIAYAQHDSVLKSLFTDAEISAIESIDFENQLIVFSGFFLDEDHGYNRPILFYCVNPWTDKRYWWGLSQQTAFEIPVDSLETAVKSYLKLIK